MIRARTPMAAALQRPATRIGALGEDRPPIGIGSTDRPRLVRVCSSRRTVQSQPRALLVVQLPTSGQAGNVRGLAAVSLIRRCPPMPTVQQQLSYVLNAPVPFFLTLVAAAIAIWSVIRWAYQWRYDGKIEKLEAMLRLAAEENRIAKERYADAKAVIDELEKAKAGEKSNETVTQEFSKLRLAIDSALKANTAVDDTLRRGAAFTASTVGHSPFVRSTTAISV